MTGINLDWCSYSVLLFPFLISQGGAGPGGKNGPPGDPGRVVSLYYQSILPVSCHIYT